jgi:hypothetical protein
MVEKRREKAGVYVKRALGVRNELSRAVGFRNRVLPRRGRYGSDDLFIRLAATPTAFWGGGCGRVFYPKPKYHADAILKGVLEPPVEMF